MNIISAYLCRQRIGPLYDLKECRRIKRIADEMGYEISLREAESIWKDFSEAYGYEVSFKVLPKTDEELKKVLSEDCYGCTSITERNLVK
jgi:hypothetical protein